MKANGYLKRIRNLAKDIIPDREREILLLDRTIYCKPSTDFHIYRIALAHRTAPVHHELSCIVNLMGFMSPGMVFVDVGANIGLYSAVFASVGERVGFDVVFIEPNPRTVSRLRRTLSPYSNCKIHVCACSNAKGIGMLQQTGSSLTSHLVTNNNFDNHGEDGTTNSRSIVKLETLDALCNDLLGPLVVKIDVEGHDIEVLEGANRLFKKKQILALMIDGGKSDIHQLKAFGFIQMDGQTLQQNRKAYTKLFVFDSAFPDCLKNGG